MNATPKSRFFRFARLFPREFRRKVFYYYILYRVRLGTARRFLSRVIIPTLAKRGGNVLLVGCREYSKGDPASIERNGAVCISIDIDPKAAQWGSKTRHYIGDIRDVHALIKDVSFDTVLCNGILGFGVDTQADQRKALESIAKVMKPGGVLLLGWETDRTRDPVESGLASPWFEPFAPPGLKGRYVYPRVPCAFACMRKV